MQVHNEENQQIKQCRKDATDELKRINGVKSKILRITSYKSKEECKVLIIMRKELKLKLIS